MNMETIQTMISANPLYLRLLKARYGKRGGLILRYPKTALWCVVLRDASQHGRWRYQCFDLDGFLSHHTCNGFDAAVMAAMDSGYVVWCDSDTLDRLVATPRWQRGSRVCELIQKVHCGQLTIEAASKLLQEEDRRLSR